MIEILIKYIEDKGFKVNIMPRSPSFPGCLGISKMAREHIAGYNWCIPSHDLRPEFQYALFHEADLHCDEIDQLIASKEGKHE